MSNDKFEFERYKEAAMKGLYESKKMGVTDSTISKYLL